MTETSTDTPKDEVPAKESNAAERAVASRRLDVMDVLAGAVFGAALALVIQYTMTLGGVWPAPAAPDLSSLEGRVAALELAERPAVGSETVSADVADLREQVTRLRDQVARLDARPADGQPANLGPLTQSVESLRSELSAAEALLAQLDERTPADLEERLASFAGRDAVADLNSRVMQLEEDVAHSDARKAAMALGLAQLARAARGGQPFENEFAAVEVLRPNDPLVAMIAPFAATGAPTEAALRTDFPRVARAVAHAAQTPAELTAWGRVWAWVGQYISFRRTGETEGDSVSAILARAEQRLDESDLRAALGEMNALPDSASGPAEEWIEGAEARVALDRLTTELSADVITELGR